MSVLHELDPKGIAYENGERAEDLFAKICASRGYTTTRGNYYVRSQVRERDGKPQCVIDIITLVDFDDINALSKNWPLQMMEEKQ